MCRHQVEARSSSVFLETHLESQKWQRMTKTNRYRSACMCQLYKGWSELNYYFSFKTQLNHDCFAAYEKFCTARAPWPYTKLPKLNFSIVCAAFKRASDLFFFFNL